MSDILIACAMKREAEALRKQMGGRREILATGVGIKRTVPALLARFRTGKPDLLLFTGGASQLDPSLKLGDIVVPAEWCLEDTTRCFPSHPATLELLRSAGWTIHARGLTLSSPVMRGDRRQRLYESTGAAIFDSVTAAALRVAASEGVACVAPKIVAHTTETALMAFWNRLDHNIRPLTEELERLMEVVG